MEQMFDKDSFTDEITSSAEAQSAYNYYAHNLTTFRIQLASEGLTHDQTEEVIRQCWVNLLKSSQRVGYTNSHLERMAKLYKDSLPKKTNK